MRLVFLGNHTVGVEALRALSSKMDVAGVVAHPRDPEDGVVYRSVYDFARMNKQNVVRMSARDHGLEEFIASCAPDLLWVADYRYLLPASVLSIPRLGSVNMHPGLLPRYRGRASVNWAILHGETEIGLTVHYIDESMDSGDIILQECIRLGADQDVGDALRLLYPLYATMASQVADMFISGSVPRTPQDHGAATTYPRRGPEDGVIDWSLPAVQILNLIRAVAAPYPGAFTFGGGGKIMVWKAVLSHKVSSIGNSPGKVVAVGSEGVHVQCGEGVLLITRWDGVGAVRTGIVLGGNW